MNNSLNKAYNLLLHVCCGPCSIEPLRLLLEEGYNITLFYNNSNIQPKGEYYRRLNTLKAWANQCNIPLIEDNYQPKLWYSLIQPGLNDNDKDHHLRCQLCYRDRLEHTAHYAAEHGFEGISTTLTVSPYQYYSLIEEELIRAARIYNIDAVVRDFSPYYPSATKKSRDLGMYRQNYCGCLYSKQEAEKEREERKIKREKEKERKRIAEAPLKQRQKEELEKKRKEKQAYAQKQAKKRALLKSFKDSIS